MSHEGRIVSVNISSAKGTPKQPVRQIVLDKNGIVRDAHAGPWHRQVSLLSRESIDSFNHRHNTNVKPGDFAENITTEGLELARLAVLDKVDIGPVELEVTQIGKACHGDDCAIFRRVGQCVMPTEGIFCRVLQGGTVQPQDKLTVCYRTLKILVITVSDRAYNGLYQDKSGPCAVGRLNEFFQPRRWHTRIQATVLPDDPVLLRQELNRAIDNRTDIIFTLGGTGIGPRDITPEIVGDICDKIIPGIMESIRCKYGAQKPAALLSRSIAGISDSSQIYALPGSPRAVEEYLGEITKNLEHIIFMLNGIDRH